jgi:transcription elongation factor Elf1
MRLSILSVLNFTGKRRHAVYVDKKHGTCRSCGGELEIVDADDATMTVACTECGDIYDVETDAFGDGCMTYYVGFVAANIARKEMTNGSTSDMG